MKKSEAKAMLNSLKPKIFDVENEASTALEVLLKEQLFSSKMKDFSIWFQQLPDNLFEDLKNDINNESIEELCKEYFCPSLYFQQELAWVKTLNSIEKNREDIKVYKNSEFSQVREVEEQLKYIISNDTNIIFKLFQSKEIKEKVEKAKQFVKEHSQPLSDLDKRIELWSQSREMSLDDFNNLTPKRLEWLPILQKKLGLEGYSSEEYLIKLCTQDLLELQEFVSQNSKDRILNAIIEVWERLKKIQAEKDIEDCTIDVLKMDNDYPFLKQILSNYSYLTEVLNASNEILCEQCAISDFEANTVKELSQNIVNQIQDTAYPRLKPDYLEELDFSLLNLLKNFLRYPEDRQKREDHLKNNIKSWFEKKEELKLIALNRCHANSLDFLDYSKWCENEAQLYQYYVSIKNEKYYDSPLEIIDYDTEELKRDFIQNSAVYYALIEQITGSQRVYTPTDLPSLIVKSVSKFEINKEGLSVIMRPYQEFGVKYALHYKNALLGDEMGLGKTIQAIGVANHLFQSGKKHIIIVSPLSVLENWNREVQKWSKLKTYIYRGVGRTSKYKKWRENGGVLLTNYEQCKKLAEESDKEFFDFLVVDEAHYIKNPETKRTISVTTLARLAEYKLFMTGTPLENRLVEMKYLIKLLNPKVGKKLSSKYWQPAEFRREMSTVYLRRKREEVLDELPQMDEYSLWSEFSDEQQEFYDDAVRQGISGVMKMRRAAFYGDKPQKIAQIIDICNQARENGRKVLVFSFFKEGVLNRLLEELSNVSPVMISGSISASQRQEAIDNFSNDPKQTVLLCQIEAGGVGLNIQSANIVVICEPQWKPSTEQQAIGRSYRMGQTRDVMVYRLLTKKSIDESMTKLLDKKINLFNIFANDSTVADAFSQKEKIEKISNNDSQLKQKVFEIEKRRLEEKNNSNIERKAN